MRIVYIRFFRIPLGLNIRQVVHLSPNWPEVQWRANEPEV